MNVEIAKALGLRARMEYEVDEYGAYVFSFGRRLVFVPNDAAGTWTEAWEQATGIVFTKLAVMIEENW